jgi:hypothetical protein
VQTITRGPPLAVCRGIQLWFSSYRKAGPANFNSAQFALAFLKFPLEELREAAVSIIHAAQDTDLTCAAFLSMLHTTDYIRCPYCIEGDAFKLMARVGAVRYVCERCLLTFDSPKRIRPSSSFPPGIVPTLMFSLPVSVTKNRVPEIQHQLSSGMKLACTMSEHARQFGGCAVNVDVCYMPKK